MPPPLDFPKRDTFAVIRMDPVAMVRHLNDPKALRAAEALSPRSYLVYLDRHNELRIWGPKPWHGFKVYPISPTVRPASEDECITSAMCTPIFPNANHPEGRPPLRTDPVFRFDNCYFWSGVSMDIRVCPRPEGFKRDDTIQLPGGPGGDLIQWMNYEMSDRGQQLRAIEQARRPAQSDPASNGDASEQVSQPPRTTSVVVAAPADPSVSLDNASSPLVNDAATSIYSNSAYSCSIIASTYATDSDSESVDMDAELVSLFADPERSPEFLPLCHLWTDVVTNIKQDDIPSPVHLFEEREAIVRIIREARARNPSIPPLPVPNNLPSDPSSAAPPPAREELEDSEPETKPKRFRPVKLLRKIGLRVRTLHPHVALTLRR